MKSLRILLCMMIGLVIGLVVGVILVNVTHKHPEKKETTTQTETEQWTTEEPATETATPADAEGQTSEMTEEQDMEESAALDVQDEQQPEALRSALQESLVSFAQLAEVSCKQLIVVDSNQTTATISMYTCDDTGLWTDTGLSTSGYVGAAGVSRESYEGSKMTPAGVFPIGEAFYIGDPPKTGLNLFEVTEHTYWIDDPDSELYNQRVESSGEKTWNSAEHMIDYASAYKYGFVVNYNMNPVEAGRGSAIFFHIGDGATLGCIATSEEMVLSYLANLSAEENPYIVIN